MVYSPNERRPVTPSSSPKTEVDSSRDSERWFGGLEHR